MISSIKFHQMRHSEYLVLGTRAADVLSKFDESELQLTKPKASIATSLARLKNSMKTIKTNFRTQELALLDLKRDDSWKCFYYLLISQSYNLDLSIRDQATKLVNIVRSPDMRIYKMGYQDQTACMINFFNRVDSNEELTAAITAVGATAHYAQVKTSEQAFEEKNLEKDQEESEKPNAEGNKAAKEVRESIEGLNRFLMVMKDLTNKEEYDKIAAQINETVIDINTKVSARVTRRENSKEEEDSSTKA